MNKVTTATFLLVTGGLVGLAPSIATGDTQSGLNIGDNDSVYVDGKSFQVIPGKAKGDTAAQIKSLAARDLGPAAIIIRSGNKLYIVDTQSEMASAQSHSVAAAPTNYAYDPRPYNPGAIGGGSVGYNQQVATNYAYDPRSINPTLQGGGSAGYNQHVATNYAYDPRSINPTLQGGGSAGYNQHVATDYAYDPRSINPTLQGGGSIGYNRNVATDYAYDPRAYPIRNPDPWANNYAYDPRRVAAAQPSVIYDSDYVEYRLKKAFDDNWTPVAAPTSTK